MRRTLFLALFLLPACAGISTQPQKIAAACATMQTAGAAIVLGTNAGKISKADAAKAYTVYHAMLPFCSPPVASLSVEDYGALLAAAASLAATAGGVP